MRPVRAGFGGPVDVQRIANTLREATAASGLSRSALYRLIGEGKLCAAESCRQDLAPCYGRAARAHYFGCADRADRADPRCGVGRRRWRLIVANRLVRASNGGYRRTPQFQRRRLGIAQRVRRLSGCAVRVLLLLGHAARTPKGAAPMPIAFIASELQISKLNAAAAVRSLLPGFAYASRSPAVRPRGMGAAGRAALLLSIMWPAACLVRRTGCLSRAIAGTKGRSGSVATTCGSWPQ